MASDRTPPRPLILVVDDQPGDRRAFEALLTSGGYQVTTAASLAEALARVAQPPFPDAALLDVYLTDGTGLDLLSALHERLPRLPVVMISGRADISLAVDATRRGAFDFLEKPPRSEAILLSLRNALERRRLEEENRRLRESGGRPRTLIVESPGMRELLERVALVAPRRTPVLITGESGVGKEEIARLLHLHGPEPEGPWIAFNVAAVPRDLAESTLFGHEKGAFTSAVARHRGLFEQADGGTLFLDEIGEMPAAMQARLLRAIEEGSIRRVGGEKTIPVRPRIVAATNRNLQEEIDAGRFRLDLYHRLAVVTLHVPPLRERREDIVPLATHFAARFAEQEHLAPRTLAPEAAAYLEAHPWPGNVRELRNLIERALILTRSATLAPEDLQAPTVTAGDTRAAAEAMTAEDYALPVPRRATMEDAIRRLEERHLREALTACGWNVTRAAARLGLDRTTCHRKIVAHDLKRPGDEA
jgi:two-component system nitrogen regulation response regulator NtrX